MKRKIESDRGNKMSEGVVRLSILQQGGDWGAGMSCLSALVPIVMIDDVNERSAG